MRQARQAIRKARRQQPQATIIVTGCAAQLEPETFAAMAEVDLVLGNREKLQGVNFVAPLEGEQKSVLEGKRLDPGGPRII